MKPTASFVIRNLEAPSPASGASINPNDRHLGQSPKPQSPSITKPPWFHLEIKKEYSLAIKIYHFSHLVHFTWLFDLEGNRAQFLHPWSYRTEKKKTPKNLACIILHFCFLAWPSIADLNFLWKVKTQTHTWKTLKIYSFTQNWWWIYVCPISYFRNDFEDGNLSNYIVTFPCFSHNFSLWKLTLH